MADDPTTTTTNHLFDDPSLDALQFLAAVMHAREADITDRIAAAAALLPYYQPPFKPSERPWHNVTRTGKYIPGDKDWIVRIRIEGMPEHVGQEPIVEGS
jgi:hypothetical protein